jgi:tetratricopeptide (TPR) repeat protein
LIVAERLPYRLGIFLLWLMAVGLCAWAYWPGLAGPPLLDDATNLRPLQILDEQPDLMSDVVAGNLSGPLGRPLTMLSFSLEQVYLGGGVREKKQFNLWLHLLIASLLLVFSRDVFACMEYPRPLALALATASLWLFAPLLVSTVLYSVQRMAQLASLFSLLALWSYLRCRLTSGPGRAAWGLSSALALLAAPLSKENGLLALPLLFWLEWTVLRFGGLDERARQRWINAHVILVAAGLALFVAVCVFIPEYLVGGYSGRDFTLGERLLTQPRVMWTYVSQLLWADASLLGLYQDDKVLSRGLTEPLTTLPALLGWCLVGGVTLLLARRPACGAVAFGLGFFIIAHAMESTFFPLEMYFEHRNYLPAAGLFIALVSGTGLLIKRWSWCANWSLAACLALSGHALMTTAAESQLWSKNYLLHISAVNRFPDSLRAQGEMARVMAQGGNLEQALRYLSRAEQLESSGGLRHQLRRISVYCLASPAIPAEIIDGLSATAADFRDDQVSELNYVLVKNIVDGACPDTDLAALGDRLKQLTLASDPRLVSPKFYVSLAILENHSGRYKEALAHIDALLNRSPDSVRGLMMKLYFTSVLEMEGEHESVRIKLQELESKGLLNRQQQYNLGLFVRSDTKQPE